MTSFIRLMTHYDSLVCWTSCKIPEGRKLGAEEQLQILLQTYLAEYSLYASLILTGSLGALTVLLIRSTLKRGKAVFAVAYYTLVAIALFSVWRLLQYSRSVDIILRRLGLISTHVEIQGEGAWAYNFFSWMLPNMNLVLIVAFGIVVFYLMWRQVEKGPIASTQPAEETSSKPETKPIDDPKVLVEALLAEYHACHMNRDHYDSVRWTIGSIFIAASLTLFGISFVEPVVRSPRTVAVMGIFSLFLFGVWCAYNSHVNPYVKTSLRRLVEIESELKSLGLASPHGESIPRLHTLIQARAPAGRGVWIVRALAAMLIVAWVLRFALWQS